MGVPARCAAARPAPRARQQPIGEGEERGDGVPGLSQVGWGGACRALAAQLASARALDPSANPLGWCSSRGLRGVEQRARSPPRTRPGDRACAAAVGASKMKFMAQSVLAARGGRRVPACSAGRAGNPITRRARAAPQPARGPWTPLPPAKRAQRCVGAWVRCQSWAMGALACTSPLRRAGAATAAKHLVSLARPPSSLPALTAPAGAPLALALTATRRLLPLARRQRPT